MITPDQLKDKAKRLYSLVIEAWLANDDTFFPVTLRANKELAGEYLSASRDVNLLRDCAKESIGFGYSIVWLERSTRKYGLQKLPSAFQVDSLQDLLRWIGKQQEFHRLRRGLEIIEAARPELCSWGHRHWRRVIEYSDQLDDLLVVVNYMRDHPRPMCYVRELPTNVSSKVIENNRSILAEWFDIVLQDGAIDHAYPRESFEDRYGFRYRSEHFLIRFRDPELMKEVGSSWRDISLPIESLQQLPIRNGQILLIENKTSLYSLPELPRTIAMGGLGYGVSSLFDIPWLSENQIRYWGDIDLDGLRMLSMVRNRFASAESFLMDGATLQKFGRYVEPDARSSDMECPENLTETEAEAFRICKTEHWKLEQEHISAKYIAEQL